jgi:hypothetical protein
LHCLYDFAKVVLVSMNPNPTPDAASRLWAQIERLDGTSDERTVRAAELGKLFYQLRALYSQRANSAARRPTSGHGVFQAEILKRGYKPNRVREWVNDYEVQTGIRPASESTAAKRKARRQHEPRNSGQASADYDRGYRAAFRDFPTASAGLSDSDPLTRFASLLPFSALKTAYRAALQECHPDHGGSEERTKELIAAWEAVEHFYEVSKQYDGDTRHYERTQ